MEGFSVNKWMQDINIDPWYCETTCCAESITVIFFLDHKLTPLHPPSGLAQVRQVPLGISALTDVFWPAQQIMVKAVQELGLVNCGIHLQEVWRLYFAVINAAWLGRYSEAKSCQVPCCMLHVTITHPLTGVNGAGRRALLMAASRGGWQENKLAGQEWHSQEAITCSGFQATLSWVLPSTLPVAPGLTSPAIDRAGNSAQDREVYLISLLTFVGLPILLFMTIRLAALISVSLWTPPTEHTIPLNVLSFCSNPHTPLLQYQTWMEGKLARDVF